MTAAAATPLLLFRVSVAGFPGDAAYIYAADPIDAVFRVRQLVPAIAAEDVTVERAALPLPPRIRACSP